jgi:hypothetical protein
MEDFAAMYIGPERRARRVYVTRNHEYHCKSGVCVAVRDVLSGAFVDDHEALGRVAGGVIHPYRDGVGRSIGSIQTATPGTRVHFSFDADDSCSVLTSAIESIERPPPEVVALYDRP